MEFWAQAKEGRRTTDSDWGYIVEQWKERFDELLS